jgi:hypothetical protein
VSEAYRKLRGTLRFLLGNLADYDPAQHAVPYEALPAVDRWLLAKHAELMAEVADAYDTYQVRRGFGLGLIDEGGSLVVQASRTGRRDAVLAHQHFSIAASALACDAYQVKRWLG